MAGKTTPTVRVLQAVIALSIGALAFKGADLATAVAEAVDEETKPAAETALTAGIGDHAEASGEAAEGEEAPPAAAGEAGQCLPSLDYAAEMGVTQQEILVLRSLADRRKELDEREAGLLTREQTAAAAEARLSEQITGLKSLEGDVQKLLAQMDDKRDERMLKLVKTYEGMKPGQAAAIFNSMEDPVLIDLAKSMKPATLAPIMAAMDVRRAEKLTRALAELAAPPATPAATAAAAKTDG